MFAGGAPLPEKLGLGGFSFDLARRNAVLEARGMVAPNRHPRELQKLLLVHLIQGIADLLRLRRGPETENPNLGEAYMCKLLL